MIVQWALIDVWMCAKREVVRNSIKANFTEIQKNNYEVLLEVSSNKFLVNMVKSENWVESFEIIAVKGFMELSKKIVELVKKIILHLWEMID